MTPSNESQQAERLFKVNENTFRGSNSTIFLLPPFSLGFNSLKVEFAPTRCKFIPFKVDPILDELLHQGSKQTVKKVISHKDIECTCLTKQEKRRAFLLCCIRLDEPCPIHTSNFTDSTPVQPELDQRRESKKLSLYQKIKNILFRKKNKDLTQEQNLEILQETKEIPHKIQEVPSHDLKDTAAEQDIVTENDNENTEDDLFAAVVSSMAEAETRRRRRQTRKSKEILRKYASYDENRERILS